MRSSDSAVTPTPALLIFVLGVAAWALLWDVVESAVWAVVPALLAVTLARSARRAVTEASGSVYGVGLVVTGVVLAWAALALSIVAIVNRVWG